MPLIATIKEVTIKTYKALLKTSQYDRAKSKTRHTGLTSGNRHAKAFARPHGN
jgi:hypothetical protein